MRQLSPPIHESSRCDKKNFRSHCNGGEIYDTLKQNVRIPVVTSALPSYPPRVQTTRDQTLGRCRSVHSQYSEISCSSRTTSGLAPVIVVLYQLWGVALELERGRDSQLVGDGDEGDHEERRGRADVPDGELALVRVGEGKVLPGVPGGRGQTVPSAAERERGCDSRCARRAPSSCIWSALVAGSA